MSAVAPLVRALAARDPFMQALGVTVTDVGPGRVVLSMVVREAHLNFNGTCHGGVLFAFADSAFGLASNANGVIAAGIDAHISYPAAARPGDVLTATAHELTRSKRLGTYRIDVTRAPGEIVAAFTGTVFVTGRAHDAEKTARDP